MSSNTDQPGADLSIDEHRIVLMHYELSSGFGEVIDTSLGGLPMSYMHNSGALLPSLERELTGRWKGDEFEVAIYPEDAYGYLDEELVTELSREAFADVGELHVGMRVRDKGRDGEPALFTVLVIGDDTVTVDGNHPLAGQVLHFRIAVIDVREPSEKEIKEQLGAAADWSPPWLQG